MNQTLTNKSLRGEFSVHSEQDSINLARKIASALGPKDVLALRGVLGSGKTFLCRAIIREFCGRDIQVPSPTFNLLQIYETNNFLIYHFDLYRLKARSEIYELGIEEALASHVTLIEWPEIIAGWLPQNTIWLDIAVINRDKRLISFQSAQYT